MKKMKNNKMLEYNMKLGEEYFLVDNENEWKLLRNKICIYEVMNSKDNTEEELKKFIKEHTMLNYYLLSGLENVIICIIAIILGIINIKIRSLEIKGLTLGMVLATLIDNLLRVIVNSHNHKIKDKIFEEDKTHLLKLQEELEKEIEEKKNEKKRKN